MAADGRPMASASFVALVTRVVELEETSTATGPLREALQALLSRFPLCFGYWKRLAELELAHESETAAVAVYERAVVPLAFSVDMWSLYVGHAARHWLAQPERVRALCERGALLVGSDYGADSFWDAYLTCEAAAAAADPSADASRVGALYVRVLALPLRAADAYWLRFQRFAAGCGSSAEVLSREGEARVRAELAGNGAADTGADGEDDGARKMRVLALVEDRFRRHREMHAEQVGLECAVRRRFFHIRPVDAADLSAWGRILAWHRNRPTPTNSRGDRNGAAHPNRPSQSSSHNGHAVPGGGHGAERVERVVAEAAAGEGMRAAEAGAGLAAAWTGAEGWAVTAGGGHGLCGGALSCGMEGEAPAASAPADAVERCCVAYERALLPCASDRSLWLEYALHLETAGRVAAARGVLQRATGRFFTACVPTLLAHAAFEEEHGDLVEARRLCSLAASCSPPSLEAILASANLERRAGLSPAPALASGANRLSGDALALLARHAAAAEWRAGRADAGQAVLGAALHRQPHNEATWEAAIAFEMELELGRKAGPGGAEAGRGVETRGGGQVDGSGACGSGGDKLGGALHPVAALFERMVGRDTPLSRDAKRRAWVRYQQYIDDHCSSVALSRRLKRHRDAVCGAPVPPLEPSAAAPPPLPPQPPPAASRTDGALAVGGGAPTANGHSGAAAPPPAPLVNGGTEGVHAAPPPRAPLASLTPEQAAQHQMAAQHAASHAQWQHYQQYYAHHMAQQSYAHGYGYYRNA